ncbi:hypothetical protein [Ferrimicrobium sp.]|uniref:hypothetical protein n=1 Tax=Ferrimicrobium sp. TaxID=2926050 RepID=UPI002613A449|nr:hypothetical protein [Ferrimicrobium sp.]
MTILDPLLVFAQGEDLWVVDRYLPVGAVVQGTTVHLERLGDVRCRDRWHGETPLGTVLVSTGLHPFVTVIARDGEIRWRHFPAIASVFALDDSLLVMTSDGNVTEIVRWTPTTDEVRTSTIPGSGAGCFRAHGDVYLMMHTEGFPGWRIYRYEGEDFVLTDLGLIWHNELKDARKSITIQGCGHWPDASFFRRKWGPRDATGEPTDVLVHLLRATSPPAEVLIFPTNPVWLRPSDPVDYQIPLPGRMWQSCTIGETIVMVIRSTDDSRVYSHRIGSRTLRELEVLRDLAVTPYDEPVIAPDPAAVSAHVEQALATWRQAMANFHASYGSFVQLEAIEDGLNSMIAIELRYHLYPEEIFVVYEALYHNDGAPIGMVVDTIDLTETLDTGRIPTPEWWRRDHRGRIILREVPTR